MAFEDAVGAIFMFNDKIKTKQAVDFMIKFIIGDIFFGIFIGIFALFYLVK